MRCRGRRGDSGDPAWGISWLSGGKGAEKVHSAGGGGGEKSVCLDVPRGEEVARVPAAATASPKEFGDAREVLSRAGPVGRHACVRALAACLKLIESSGDFQHLSCLGSWKPRDFSGR